MNVDDPFADDLNSFDVVVAQLAAEQGGQMPPLHPPSGPSTVPAPPPRVSTTGLEGRRGRRDVLVPKGTERHVQPSPVTSATVLTGSKGTVNDEPMPWDIDDNSQPTVRSRVSITTSQSAPSVTFISGKGLNDTTVASKSADDEDKDDPLAFLERDLLPAAQIVSSSYAASGVGGGSGIIMPTQQRQNQMEEELREKEERRDLFSSLDAVGMELDELQSALEILRIKADTELTDLETKVMGRQTELASSEDRILVERRAYEEYHQQRLKEVSDRTPELIQQQQKEVILMEKERYEGQLRVLSAAVEDAQTRVNQLSQQRELLLQHHRYDEKGVLVALSEEELKDTERISAAGSGISGSSVDVKINAALRLFWRHYRERLESLSNGVVGYIHQETMDVAREVRERREMACLEDTIRHKERFGEFMQEFLQRYREFFRHRAELRSSNMTTLRQELQQATEQLRQHARKRLETRTQEVALKMNEITRRFGKIAVESIECVRRKYAAVRESDDSVARSQLADLEHRCQAEQAVTGKLQRSEVEMMQQQLDRMRRWGEDRNNESERDAEGWGGMTALRQEAAQSMCTVRAESITSKVRELELAVQQLIREQLSKNRLSRVEGEGHLFLTDEELNASMAMQEKGAIIASLLEEVRNQQTELLATRQRCGELREHIAARLQEEVQIARQQRLTQEVHFANNELLRIAWEREQRELLKWGNDMLFPHGEPTCNRVTAQTHIPAATATVEIMNLLADRNRALIESRAKLREQRHQLFHTITKKQEEILGERREVETRWVQLCEQLLELMVRQDAVAVQREAVTVEIAKLEVAKELLGRDKELFCQQYREVQEETERLKRTLQETLGRRTEQGASQQKHHHLVTGNSPFQGVAVDNVNALCIPAKRTPRFGSLPACEASTLHRSINSLQEERGCDNIRTPTGKQLHDDDNDYHQRGKEEKQRGQRGSALLLNMTV